MSKIKRRGYILFSYYCGSIQSFDYCANKKELMRKHDSEIDDKWDMEGRNKIHYFYLDISENKYTPLPKWGKDYNEELKFNQSDETVLSTNYF